MYEVENVLRIFNEVKSSLKNKDFSTISNLSNQTINTASRTHDPNNIAVAVLVYTISKIVKREIEKDEKTCDEFCKKTIPIIDKIISALKKNDGHLIQNSIKELRVCVEKESKNFKIFTRDVLRMAEINKASRIFEHGISIEKTANLLGLTIWELTDSIGNLGIPGIEQTRKSKFVDVKSRIKTAEEMFE